MKLAASQPSTTRWSQLSDRFMRLRTSISPSITTTFSSTLLTAMIATSGRLITGVEVIPPSGPRLDSVIDEPDSSSREALPLRAASARRRISLASCQTLNDSAPRITGTIRPLSVWAAGRNAAAVVEYIGVKVRVAQAVARGFHSRKVDAEVARPGADRRRSEDVGRRAFPDFGLLLRFGRRGLGLGRRFLGLGERD